MIDFKKQDGLALEVVLIILVIIIIICTFLVLDIFGYIDVPEQFSITKFLETSTEEVYQGETIDKEEHPIKQKVRDDYDIDENVILNTSDSISRNNVSSYSSNNNDNDRDSNFNDNSSYNRYYYSQLDSNGKIIYDGIVDNIDNLKTGTYTIDFGKKFNDLLQTSGGDSALNNAFQSAVNAALLDNPEIFFLDITKLFLLTKSTSYAFFGTTYEVSIGPSDNESYLNADFDESKIYRAEARLSSIKNSIIAELNGDTLDNIKQIHDYLVSNLEYDSTFQNDNIYNIYGALVNKSTVCEGYAKAFKYLMDGINIPCIVVCGTAQNSNGEIENHAWNYICLDDNWYAVDVTWDDPVLIGNGVLSKEAKYRYYLKGANSLFKDHEEDNCIVENVYFDYPKLSEEDY